MKRKLSSTWRWPGVALVLTLVTAGSVFAHHGWSHYDASKTLNFTGVIRESSYANPHGLIRLQVDGNGKTWHVVLAPPSRMSSRGLSKNMVKVGATATVVGYPHKQKADEMRAERITIDGKTTELR
ncbi:MAG TPA: DUF6152 family protein [Pyrinomonadaceae bacterium]|nr:DUF6152 family protein [Pyrinomonadaceae bacterium]